MSLSICKNCTRKIVDVAPSYSYYNTWVHEHSQHRECDAPNVAIPVEDNDE